MKKFLKSISIILFAASAFLFYIIYSVSNSVPTTISLTEGDSPKLNTMISGVSIRSEKNENVAEVSSNASAGNVFNGTLKLWNTIPIKDVTVNVVKEKRVIVCGTPFGIKMFTDGVVVCGLSEIQTSDGVRNPGAEAGIVLGDVITSINGEAMRYNDDIARISQQSDGKPMNVKLRRKNIEMEVTITPAKCINEGKYKLGLWVRDSSAGIGTLTYYDTSNSTFAGLGHGICDNDTGEILPLNTGEIVDVTISDVVRSQKGTAGELRGSFKTGIATGKLLKNSETGVYGVLNSAPKESQEYEVAMKHQVVRGKAQIITTLHGETPKMYDIMIDKVHFNDKSPTKNMIIKITDPELLEQTGGIVQGMSGSPIIQDGKLVGAITHVFVNDPTCGYGIFAENMCQTTVNLSSDDIYGAQQKQKAS